MEWSCPGKVFITGEYSCIVGGPALLGTVAPRFSLRLTRSNSIFRSPFDELSPAGRYVATRPSTLMGWEAEWVDPHETPIGVGSSSAQFLLAMAAVAALEGKDLPDAAEVLRQYWAVSVAPPPVPGAKTTPPPLVRPSGADVVAQLCGGPLVFRNTPCETRRLAPWSGGGVFLLAYTGFKTRTHEHLATLSSRGFPARYTDTFHLLDDVTAAAVGAWEAGDAKALGKSLNDYQKALAGSGIGDTGLTQKLREISAWHGVLGCKGSGAQGGDCVLLLVEPSAREDISQALTRVGWAPREITWDTKGLTSP